LAGDNQSAVVGLAVATPPSVKVTSASGAGVSGVVVTFAVASGGGSVTGGTPSTGGDGVATVGSWTLGSSAGPNTLTATIASAGVTGNPATFSALGQPTVFNPTANANLSGTQNFTSINIPAGVTITATGDLVLNATGAVTIAGNLVSDCKNITVNADGALVVSGNLNTGCPGGIPAAGAPALVLVGKGGWTLNGPGAWTAGGEVTVTNDPTLSDANFSPAGQAPAHLRAKGPLASVGEPCINNGYSGTAVPDHAPHGTAGTPDGTKGEDGKPWTLRCKGGSSIIISGALTLTGQNGGDGGSGTHSSSTAAGSKGGNGGKGGAVNIQAIDNISIGAGGVIFTGDGGRGGDATANASAGHGGDIGGGATATGGVGASPGLFSAVAKNGSISIGGSLNIDIGSGGRGGSAFATGGDGHDAPACPAALGGPATATAGDGGSTPDKKLQAAGAVNGLGNVTVGGGAPGEGGNAIATAGNGGKGEKPCKDGAAGGTPTARGGKGGDAELRNQNGSKVANGGNGGSAEFRNAKGGKGWNDCILPIFEEGGKGGRGGSTSGFNGSGGTGFATGTYGDAIFNLVSNGADGGNGLPPGAGGLPGDNSAFRINVAGTFIEPSFQPGLPGAACPAAISWVSITPDPVVVIKGNTFSINVLFTRFNFTLPILVTIKDQDGTTRGSGTIAGTSGTVSGSVPSGEPTGNRVWTATGSGTGVTSVIRNLNLTVNAPAPPATVDADLNTMPHTGSTVPFGNHVLLLKVGSAIRGFMNITTFDIAGNHFWSNSGAAGLRVGSGNDNGFGMQLNTAQVDGVPYSVVGVGYCLLNATGIGVSTPVVVNVRNLANTIIQTQSVTSLPNSNLGPQCHWANIPAGGTSLEIRAPVGAGRFIDSGSWQLWTVAP
jgi:hypothetical protein